MVSPTQSSIRSARRRKAKKAYACCVNLALGTALVLVLFCNSIWAGLLSIRPKILATSLLSRSHTTPQEKQQHLPNEHGEKEEEVVEGEEEEEEVETTESEGEWINDADAAYDAQSEDPVDRCRRDPTWRRTVTNYHDCQQLMNWEPRDTWWRLDTGHNDYVFDGHVDDIHACIARRFDLVKTKASALRDDPHFAWTQCNEDARDESCRILPTRITAYYKNFKEGEAVLFENAFCEQEAFALRAMQDCMFVYLDKELPWWEDRKFGATDRYDVVGGNEVTFVQGSIQLFLPGIAATLYRNFNMAYKEGNWRNAGFQNLGYPPPNTLGIRTAEALAYHSSGQLGTHTDSDSVFTIAIHLSDEESYEGGNFRLSSEHAFFKVPRLGAVSFFADSDHGVTKVTRGDRNIFVVELWENDDAPPGTPRPDFKAWDAHMQRRWPIVVGQKKDYLHVQGADEPETEEEEWE
jgi:hypothetical protein